MAKPYFDSPHWDLYSIETEAAAPPLRRYTLGLWACALLVLLCFAPAAFSAPAVVPAQPSPVVSAQTVLGAAAS